MPSSTASRRADRATSGMPDRYPRIAPGGVPERSKGIGCKPIGSAFGGSNPPPRHVCAQTGAAKPPIPRSRQARLFAAPQRHQPHDRDQDQCGNADPSRFQLACGNQTCTVYSRSCGRLRRTKTTRRRPMHSRSAMSRIVDRGDVPRVQQPPAQAPDVRRANATWRSGSFDDRDQPLHTTACAFVGRVQAHVAHAPRGRREQHVDVHRLRVGLEASPGRSSPRHHASSRGRGPRTPVARPSSSPRH